MERPIIQIESLKRDFALGTEVVRALRGISFTINKEEFVTIMGASGSGKSTLLNILGCLDQASEGVYKIDDIMVKNLSGNELANIRNKKIGFIFQAYNLLPRTTALENVELPLVYNSLFTAKQRRELALEALHRVGLSDRLHHTPSQLSGGQQQRVAIARSLVNDPVVILADEATGNLDSRTSYEIMDLFQDLNQKGKTIIFVTHEPDIAALSKRIVLLKDGRIIKDEPVQNFLLAKNILSTLPKED